MVKGGRNIYHAHTIRRKAGVAILISNKVDFKVRNFPRDKKRCLRSIQPKDITILKHVYLKVHKTKTDRIKIKNKSSITIVCLTVKI